MIRAGSVSTAYQVGGVVARRAPADRDMQVSPAARGQARQAERTPPSTTDEPNSVLPSHGSGRSAAHSGGSAGPHAFRGRGCARRGRRRRASRWTACTRPGRTSPPSAARRSRNRPHSRASGAVQRPSMVSRAGRPESREAPHCRHVAVEGQPVVAQRRVDVRDEDRDLQLARRTHVSTTPRGSWCVPTCSSLSGGPRELDRAHGGAHDQRGGHERMVSCPPATVDPDFPDPAVPAAVRSAHGIGRGRRAMKVAGTTVVVTGAGDGIGRELVLGLLARGARVAAVSRSADHLRMTADACGRPGGPGVRPRRRRRRPAGRRGAARRRRRRARPGRRPDQLRRASSSRSSRCSTSTTRTSSGCMAVNFWGPVHTTKAFLPAPRREAESAPGQRVEHGRVPAGPRADRLRSVEGGGAAPHRGAARRAGRHRRCPSRSSSPERPAPGSSRTPGCARRTSPARRRGGWRS